VHGYRDLPAHRAVHEKLTAEAQAFHKNLQVSGTVLTIDVMSFLRTWLTNHIMQADQEYAGVLKQAGAR
jgi:hemerythrin-like metal-binding protein